MISSKISDEELIEKIKLDDRYFTQVYEKCKSNSVQFISKMASGSNITKDDIEDIFQVAITIFYVKIKEENFKLRDEATIQTYVNKVCKIQLYNRFKFIEKFRAFEKEYLKDLFKDSENPIEEKKEKEKRFKCLYESLNMMQESGGKCHDLINLFHLQQMSISDLTLHFDYTNDVNTRKQKKRCVERLKVLAANCMNN